MKPLLPFCRRVAVPEQRCSQHPAGTAAPRAPLPAPCQQLFSKTQTCFAMRPHPQPPSTASACLLPPSRHPLLCLWEGGVVRAVQSPLCNPTVAPPRYFAAPFSFCSLPPSPPQFAHPKSPRRKECEPFTRFSASAISCTASRSFPELSIAAALSQARSHLLFLLLLFLLRERARRRGTVRTARCVHAAHGLGLHNARCR